MDTQELSKRYMEVYEKLAKDFKDLNINDIVTDLNDAISRSDMEKTGELYGKVIEWNGKVEKLEGARLALDTQFRYLRLPSPAAYGIIFDGEEKVWKFFTGRG